MRWLVRFWKRDPPPPKEFKIVYGWASPKVAKLLNCPYIYVFKLTTVDGAAVRSGLRRGIQSRGYVFSKLLFKSSSNGGGEIDGEIANIWNEIIPSNRRPPTHRVELGILRKGSGIPRSPLFSEYFCFTPLNGKTSDQVAIQIAGFVASELECVQSFDGERIGDNRAYWMLCIYAAWKEFGR